MNTTDANAFQETSLALDDQDIGPLLIDRLQLTWNGLSPFTRLLDAYATGSASTDVRLADHPLLARILPLLAWPDVRISHRAGGPAISTFAAYWRRDYGEDAIVVVCPSSAKKRLVRWFDSSAEYFAWWLHAASSGAEKAIADSKDFTLPPEAMLYWLHALDMCRRASYQRMLSYEAPEPASVSVTQFIDAMPKSIATRDPHWLLPSFLLLAPGLDTLELELLTEHLKLLADRGFLMPGKNTRNDEQVFLFSDALTATAEEFLGGFEAATGLEISLWTERGVMPMWQAFLAPSPTANHLIELERAADGNRARHRALTQRQLYARLVGLLSAALNPAAPQAALKRSATKVRPFPEKPDAGPSQTQEQKPLQLACPKCKLLNPATMKLCGHSGSPLAPEPDNLSQSVPPQGTLPNEHTAHLEEDAALPLGPAISVREWFRTLSFSPNTHFIFRNRPDDKRIIAVERSGKQAKQASVPAQQILDLARLLRGIRDQKVVQDEEFKTLHTALLVKDPYESWWTVGLESLRWNRMEQGRWVAGAAPEMTHIDLGILQETAGKLQQIPPGNRVIGPADIAVTPPPTVKPPLSEQSCPICGKPIRIGAKFCSYCGTRAPPAEAPPSAVQGGRVEAQSCPVCHKPLRPGATFCSSCGSKIDSAPLPVKPEVSSFEVSEQALHKMLLRVQYAIAKNGASPQSAVSGLLMTVDSRELRAVATDGHRLALTSYPLAARQAINREFVVPRAIVAELMETLTDRHTPIVVELTATQVHFRIDGKLIGGDLFNEAFPDYHGIIPKTPGNVMRASRQDLLQVLIRVSGGDAIGVQWTLTEGSLALGSKNEIRGNAQGMLAVKYRGPALSPVFNAVYLIDALNSLDCEEVEFALASSTSSATLTVPGQEDFLYVVMPMRPSTGVVP